MAYVFKYDVFIAYASADAGNARRLYRVLDAVGYKVFLDSERLVGGDKWIRKIKEAHQQSLLTIVLQSDRSQSSHFQGEEILDAIDLSRGEGARRVVPVYL